MPTLGAARYSRTVEKVTVGMSASKSQAEACDIMSAMSSCAALGNMVSCSTNGSVHAAFRSTSQSPACHSAAALHLLPRHVVCPGVGKLGQLLDQRLSPRRVPVDEPVPGLPLGRRRE